MFIRWLFIPVLNAHVSVSVSIYICTHPVLQSGADCPQSASVAIPGRCDTQRLWFLSFDVHQAQPTKAALLGVHKGMEPEGGIQSTTVSQISIHYNVYLQLVEPNLAAYYCHLNYEFSSMAVESSSFLGLISE